MITTASTSAFSPNIGLALSRGRPHGTTGAAPARPGQLRRVAACRPPRSAAVPAGTGPGPGRPDRAAVPAGTGASPGRPEPAPPGTRPPPCRPAAATTATGGPSRPPRTAAPPPPPRPTPP